MVDILDDPAAERDRDFPAVDATAADRPKGGPPPGGRGPVVSQAG